MKKPIKPTGQAISPASQEVALQLAALSDQMRSYTLALEQLNDVEMPAFNADLVQQLRTLRENAGRAFEALRVQAFQLGWAEVTRHTGIQKGNLVEVAYKKRIGLLTLTKPSEYVMESERLQVESLTLSQEKDGFVFSLQGPRLLKTGKPGKAMVQVPLQAGLTATILAGKA